MQSLVYLLTLVPFVLAGGKGGGGHPPVHCPPSGFAAHPSFNLDTLAGRWYILKQQETVLLSESLNFCVFFEFEKHGSSDCNFSLTTRVELTRVDTMDIYANDRTQNGVTIIPSLLYNTTLKNPSTPSKLSISSTPGGNPLISSFPFWILSSTNEYILAISGIPVSESSEKKCSPNGSTHNGGISDTGKGMWLLSRSPTASDEQWKNMMDDVHNRGLDWNGTFIDYLTRS